jgi:glutathione synthase/RimK-type ligase-like ATP-grasp enzyme
MVKHIIVIGSRKSQQGESENLADYAVYFQKALIGEPVEVSHALFDDLIIDVAPDRFDITLATTGKSLADFALIIIRGRLRYDTEIAYALSSFAKERNIPSFNTYLRHQSSSKLTQALRFREIGVPFPRTLLADRVQVADLVAAGKLELPFIYKAAVGAHGNSNYLIRTIDQLAKLDIEADKNFIAQPFIKNNGDYRILVCGDESLVIKRLAVSGSHLNNTSQGGQAELVEALPNHIIADAHKIAREFGMLVAGVDVLWDETSGDYFFLETNSQPQIKTGAFVEEKNQLVGRLLRNLLS